MRAVGRLALSAWAARWIGSQHLRPIASIATGTALAQALGILVTPVITRLFSPAEYGAAAVYAAIVTIGASIATGRYESAITLPLETEPGEEAAISLVRVAVAASALTSVFALLLVTALHKWTHIGWLQPLGDWVYAIPFGILASAVSATLSVYATRRRNYGAIARIPPTQKVVTASVQLGGGLTNLGLTGLMLGSLISPLVGLGILGKSYRTGKAERLNPGRHWAGMRLVARSYSDFPKVGLWFALLNATAWNMQVVVLTQYYGATQVGQFALSLAVIALPMGMILAGVSQVYMRECAARVNDKAGALSLARKTAEGTLIISIPLFLALALASKYLFGYVFGRDWAQAGSIAFAMIPLLWARFLTTSLTATLNVYRRQGVLLVWQVFALALTLLAFLTGGERNWSITETTWLASALGAPVYLLLLPIVFTVIRGGTGRRLSDP